MNYILINGKREKYYNVDNIECMNLTGYPTVKKRGRAKNPVIYYNIANAFDIETTNVKSDKPYAFMYHWQFCLNDDIVIFGTTWEEYIRLCQVLQKKLELSDNKRLVVYVHNLGFEFQFLWSQLPEVKEVFARKKRKVLKFLSMGIEYRCSYMLSNMSLDKFCENSEGVMHNKLTGTYDYHKFRLPTTTTTPHELRYDYNDVKGLTECITYRMKEYDLANMPLTSTGYVRRDFRKAMLSNPKNKELVKKLSLNKTLYTMLREAFRGGNTHANAIYVNMTMEKVRSYDISSSYPGSMIIDKYPMTPFISANPNRFSELIKSEKYAMLFRARYTTITFIADHGIPYIPVSKTRNSKGIVNDNGRVLFAETIEMTITDKDYKIIANDYIYENVEVSNIYISKYDYLPNEYRNEIVEYFRQKTTLKNVAGKEYEYMKSKNRLNSAYGMMVTDICNDTITFSKDGEWGIDITDVDEMLDKYNKNPKTFLAYQWGVWVTCNARMRLERMLHIVGDDVIYTDTDSIKFINNHDNDFEKENEKIKELIAKCGITATINHNGKDYNMGIWDFDGDYSYFKTLGAKKYISCNGSKATVTVAGLNKKLASLYINGIAKRKKMNPCDLFTTGMIFEKSSGRTTAFYNDVSRETLSLYNTTFTSGSNVAIMETTYILGVTEEYENIFNKIQKKC